MTNIEKMKEVVRDCRILEEIKKDCVFSVDISDNGEISIGEECDGFYSAKLSKNEILELANVFTELANLINE